MDRYIVRVSRHNETDRYLTKGFASRAQAREYAASLRDDVVMAVVITRYVRMVADAQGYHGVICERMVADAQGYHGVIDRPIRGTDSNAALIARAKCIDAAERLGIRFEE